MNTYVELVRRRLEDRTANLLGNLEDLPEAQLRFTMRIFGDCVDDEAAKSLFAGYSEHLSEEELRNFAKAFIPAYTEYAITELEEKKRQGERFDPPFLTQEEYQEMSVLEKWPRIAAHLDRVSPVQLRREIARAAMLFRPYMLSDPGFNEGVLEFSLYFDLLDRMRLQPEARLREATAAIAREIARAVEAGTTEERELLLKGVRAMAGAVAGLTADPETLLGPPMEKYPRAVPPEYRLRELRNKVSTMTLKELRLSAMAYIDLLTVEEIRRIVSPFFVRFPSFFEMPSKTLRELILATAEAAGDRSLLSFTERFGSGRMAMAEPVDYDVWKLMPLEDRLALLRRDNERMDSSMMARHLARFLLSKSESDLSNTERQVALLTDPGYIEGHGEILKRLGGGDEGDRIRRLYDDVTARSARMAGLRGEERETAFREIRELIGSEAGIPGSDTPFHNGRDNAKER
ncbi:MAG: hypothetical protein H6Q84_1392 [Deltaproteobacteria bacterium]|nr:hypothetical protein [Deltaproteobacteria bacterium]